MRPALVVLAVVACIAGCASSSSPKADAGAHIDVVMSPNAEGSDFYALDDDGQKIAHAMQMVHSGQIQAAIDGPINEVIAKFEKEYAGKRVYSARGAAEGIMYGALMGSAGTKPGEHIIVIGPSWAMAYWARSYALTEMNRTTEAEADLQKALALSPMDGQYKNELAYLIMRRGELSKSLALYKEAEEYAEMTSPYPVEVKCVALRGQGYDLVELHRLDEAEAAYKKCMALIPDEPKSKGELGYIAEQRKKAASK
ncbi:tetratricopeptide repeat protein [Pinirhizobacter soli]|uniref:tetratricopeptide repeat protein n=1 Tax=Pinirhizobacter soli TaxID=2786953 RepID=UPI00202A1F60|nr:tetratricopeptide repeat protein [Pinirhizobacter soli]